jgi:hypothetical protein
MRGRGSGHPGGVKHVQIGWAPDTGNCGAQLHCPFAYAQSRASGVQALPCGTAAYDAGQTPGHAGAVVTVQVFIWLQVASSLHAKLALSPYSHSNPAMPQGEPSLGAWTGHGVAPASGPPELLPPLPEPLPEDPDVEPLPLLADEPPDEPFEPELLALPPDDPVDEPPLLPPDEAPDDEPLPLPDEPLDEPPDDDVLLPLLPEVLPPEPVPLLAELPDPDPLAPTSAPPSPRLSVNDEPPQDHTAARATTARILERMGTSAALGRCVATEVPREIPRCFPRGRCAGRFPPRACASGVLGEAWHHPRRDDPGTGGAAGP